MTPESTRNPGVRCPACGASADGRYCAECGAQVYGAACRVCGNALTAGARFCNNCGAAVVAAPRALRASPQPARSPARVIGFGLFLVLVAFVAGQSAGRWFGRPATQLVAQGPSVTPAGMPAAPDISGMSPQERASRLFNRVMSYSEQGKTDSVRFFAPMAIQAYEMIGPLDLHARYDVGRISLADRDAATARAQADTILAAQPNHLLGLVLAIRAAAVTGDSAAVARYRKRLVAAAPAERAKGLKEYTEHAHDIDDALETAQSSR